MIALTLRIIAIAIAVAAMIDPVVTVTARGRPRIAILDQRPGTAATRVVSDRIRQDLRGDFDVVSGRDDRADAAIVIGDRYPDQPVPDRQRAFTVTLGSERGEADVRIANVVAPQNAPRGTLIHLDVDVAASRAVGQKSTLIVRAGDDGVEVARAEHTWGDAEERWAAALDVTPLGAPPWRLRIDVSPVPAERIIDNNAADVAVAAADPLRVVVVEPRPSWESTFVRRALERDARFEVGSVSYPTRGVSVTAGEAGALQSAAIDRTSAVIVGGLDRLTAADAHALERYMRERHGTVVLLPDSRSDVRIAGQWLAIPAATERLLEKAVKLPSGAPLPSIAAAEMLTFDRSAGMRVLARATAAGEPVITLTPYGGGRLLVSGALDAWRYRGDDNSAFDRFWQAAIGGAALASPPAIDVDVFPSVAVPGQRIELRVRVRRGALGVSADDSLPVSATLDRATPIRLWPDAVIDSFHAAIEAPRQAGTRHVEVAIDQASHATASATFVVREHAAAAPSTELPLALLADSHGGIDVTPARVAELEQQLRRDVTSPTQHVARRRMRSLWWMLPFAGCLGGEWWIRRRRGLR